MFHKNYLVPKGTGFFEIGGHSSDYKLDKFEWDILHVLSKDARASIAQIARVLNSNESTVRYRIEQLEQSGLVSGYRIELDLSKLGMIFFKAQLYLSKYKIEDLKALRVFCAKHPNITYFIEQIGDATVEIELEVSDYNEYTTIINSLRTEFPEMITNVETVLIHRSRFKWVPYKEIAPNKAIAVG